MSDRPPCGTIELVPFPFRPSAFSMSGNAVSTTGRGHDLASSRQPEPRRLVFLEKRILVVDDDTLVRRLTARVLTRSGYDVDTAEDGVAAWNRIRAGEFDLLVTDHDMPNMTGTQLVSRVREARMPLPVIIVTGRVADLEEVLTHCPWLLVSATLQKPLSPQELLESVHSVLRASQHPALDQAPLLDLLLAEERVRGQANAAP